MPKVTKPAVINNKKLLKKLHVNGRKYKLIRVNRYRRTIVIVDPPDGLDMLINDFVKHSMLVR